MAGQRSKDQEDVRFCVTRFLLDNLELSQRDLAEAVGISNCSANYPLNGLLYKGQVKLGKFKAVQYTRRYAYVLTPKGIAEKAAIAKRFLERNIQEYDALKTEAEALKEELGDNRVPAKSQGTLFFES